MKSYFLLLLVSLTGYQVQGQEYYVKAAHIPHLTVSVGTNVQFWQDRNPQVNSSTQPKLQAAISYRLRLFKHLSFDPECIVRDNVLTLFIPRGTIRDGSPVQVNTQQVYSGISSQLTLPLTIRYKWLGIGAGVFLECPLLMDYEVTLFDPNLSPSKFYGQREVNNQVGGGWQTSVEANYKRYQVRISLSQRNKLIALQKALPTSAVTAFTLGYKL